MSNYTPITSGFPPDKRTISEPIGMSQTCQISDIAPKRPTGNPDATPTALLHNIKHNKVLHENNIILKVITEDMPRFADGERITLNRLSDTFTRITLRFGDMESPNVPG